MPAIQQPSSTPKCRICGSSLVVVSQKTERLENSYSDTTRTVYRCTDEDCQKEIDKNVKIRLQQTAKQEEARQRRLDASKAGHKTPLS